MLSNQKKSLFKIHLNPIKLSSPENNVLIYRKSEHQDKVTYFLPSYVRVLLRRIKNINIEQSYIALSVTIYVSILYKGVRKRHIKNILSNIVILLNDQQTVHLNAYDINNKQYQTINDQRKQIATFITTKTLDAIMDAKIFFSPFQRLFGKIHIMICTYNFIEKDKERQNQPGTLISYKFNIMQHSRHRTIFPYIKRNMFYGQYTFASNPIYRNYTIASDQSIAQSQQRDIIKNYKPNQQQDSSDSSSDQQNQNKNQKIQQAYLNKSKNGKSKKIFPFSHIQFQLMLYRHPIVSITSIYIPLWIIALIVLLVFYQDNNYTNRIIVMATILVSFSSYYNIIRAAIPKSSHLILTQYIVYLILCTSVLGLIRALIIRQYDHLTFKQNGLEDPFFIASFAITVSSFLFIVLSYIYHKTSLEPTYHNQKFEQKSTKVLRAQWKNTRVRKYLYGFKQNLFFAQTNKQYDLPADYVDNSDYQSQNQTRTDFFE